MARVHGVLCEKRGYKGAPFDQGRVRLWVQR